MPSFIPLFPLNLVVFPGQRLNLHIFEPRYKQLIKEAWEADSAFGIPLFIDNGVSDIGCTVKVQAIPKKYPNGELDITCSGIQAFRILEFFQMVPDKLYSGAKVSFIETDLEGDAEIADDIATNLGQLFNIMQIPKTFNDMLSFTLGHHIGFNLKQEYALLCLETEKERQLLIQKHLKTVLPIVTEMENLKHRVKLNGHYQFFDPINF